METTPMTLTYEQCLERGFKRYNRHDPVFLRQNGFEYFIVELQIGNKAFEWDTHTHQVNYFLKGNIVKRGITSSEFKELTEGGGIEIFEAPIEEYKSHTKILYCVRFESYKDAPIIWQFDDKQDAERFGELLLRAKY